MAGTPLDFPKAGLECHLAKPGRAAKQIEPPTAAGMKRTGLALACVVVVAAGIARAGSGSAPHTSITVWGAATGGTTYGSTPPTGAMVVERREVDLAATGELELTGIARALDPGSVQLRSLTDPAGITITQQRFTPGATTPTEILARHVGDRVAITTANGDVAGTLRAADDHSLVVELGDGTLAVVRRDHAHDVRLATAGGDKPTLAWRLATKKPGKHEVELSYRTDAISWTADYLAVIDDAAKTVDFSAWADVKNASGATWTEAELTVMGGARFTASAPVRLGNGETIQVELFPPRAGAPLRTSVVFEGGHDASASFQAQPNKECAQFSTTTGRAEIAVEIDVPIKTPLPDGRVRTFRLSHGRLEAAGEDRLRSLAGLARIRLAGEPGITGVRRTQCTLDEVARAIRERVEIHLDNKGKQPSEVVVREFMARWPVWRIESEDRKGTRVGPQTQEYRVSLAAGGTQTVAYTVVYTW
jgi:hypothetical protein